MTWFRFFRFVALPSALLALGACGGNDAPPPDARAADVQAVDAPDTIHGITIRDAWARIADSAATGGAYVTLVNGNATPVNIVGAASAVADAVELHETTQHDGMMHMTPHATLTIAAGDSLVMAPGGLHVMLIGLHRALQAGDSVPLVLQLESGDLVPLTIPVRAP